MKEHEIQFSICEGVARVLRSEVAAAQGLLRSGQRRGVKFEVLPKDETPTQPPTAPQPPPETEKPPNGTATPPVNPPTPGAAVKYSPGPGRCAHCHEPFTEYEVQTLVGFACGHVFHLPHLLELLHPGEPVDRATLQGVSTAVMGGHLIGAKVTHARLLRERVAGGCPACTGEKEEL